MPKDVYRIVDWTKRYEPPKRENSSDGRLKFVKLAVRGFDQSAGYRMLLDIACKYESDATERLLGAIAYALFAKCLELVGNLPRESRDGAILTNTGQPASIKDIAFYTGWRREVIEEAMKVLTDPDVMWIRKEELQGSATVRRRRGRRPRDGTMTVPVEGPTAPVEEPSLNPNPKNNPNPNLNIAHAAHACAPVRAPTPAPVEEIVGYWNSQLNRPKVKEALPPERRRKLATRWQDSEFREHWREAIDEIEASSFCNGQKGWVYTFDFFVANDVNWRKAYEGNYRNHTPENDPGSTGRIH